MAKLCKVIKLVYLHGNSVLLTVKDWLCYHSDVKSAPQLKQP